MAVALLDACGVTGKLVHVDYCSILGKNDPRFYREMVASVLGAAERYGVPRSILFDCQKDPNGALESIRRDNRRETKTKAAFKVPDRTACPRINDPPRGAPIRSIEPPRRDPEGRRGRPPN